MKTPQKTEHSSRHVNLRRSKTNQQAFVVLESPHSNSSAKRSHPDASSFVGAHCGESLKKLSLLSFLQMQPQSPHLSVPTFWEGFGSVVDLSGVSISFDFDYPYERDAAAMASDWHMVGHDLMRALFRQKNKPTP